MTLYARKGAPLHRRTGSLFVYVMLIMSISGALMAVGTSAAAMNIPAGW